MSRLLSSYIMLKLAAVLPNANCYPRFAVSENGDLFAILRLMVGIAYFALLTIRQWWRLWGKPPATWLK